MPKRKCSFNDKLQQDFPYIRKSKWEDKVECTLCNTTFSISHGRRTDISDHINKKKHKDATLPSSSNKMTSFFKPTVVGKAIVNQLEASRFIAVMIHFSNHNHLKVVPALVRYFIPNLGIKVRIIEFSNLGCEIAETHEAYIMEEI
jgi:hypothetical protein